MNSKEIAFLFISSGFQYNEQNNVFIKNNLVVPVKMLADLCHDEIIKDRSDLYKFVWFADCEFRFFNNPVEEDQHRLGLVMNYGEKDFRVDFLNCFLDNQYFVENCNNFMSGLREIGIH